VGTQIEINAFSIAEDIDCQWELYLANSYTLEQLQVLDKSKIKLPEDWFKDWLSKIVEDKNQLNYPILKIIIGNSTFLEIRN
jgi:hypothetical protein